MASWSSRNNETNDMRNLRWGSVFGAELDLTVSDEVFKLAAQTKIRNGWKLTDPEVMRLLQCELPPERETQIHLLADAMQQKAVEHRRKEAKQWWLVVALALVILSLVTLASLPDLLS